MIFLCVVISTSGTEANNYIHITHTIWSDKGVLSLRNFFVRYARSIRIDYLDFDNFDIFLLSRETA